MPANIPELIALSSPVWGLKMSKNIPVSVYIITLNEAKNIKKCLDRLTDFDEVIIVDSGSVDETLDIANSFSNVNSRFNPWPGFSEQKSLALSLCRNEWVLNVDADELLTDEYISAVIETVSRNEVDALESSRTLYRRGKRPKSFKSGERLIRLFRKSAGHYEPRRVHESISINGTIERTSATIEHHENLSFSQRIEKSNRYSLAKAQDKFEKGDKVSIFVIVIIFPITLLQMYFVKGFFMDGVNGILTSMNVAFYKFMKYSKLWELIDTQNEFEAD